MLALHASRNSFEMRVLLSNLPKSENFRMALPYSSCVGSQRQSFTHRVNSSRVTSPVRKSDETIQIACHLGVGSFVSLSFFKIFSAIDKKKRLSEERRVKGRAQETKAAIQNHHACSKGGMHEVSSKSNGCKRCSERQRKQATPIGNARCRMLDAKTRRQKK